MSQSTVLDALNASLHRLFAQDERVYLLGEDLLDPYGGAFKVARGLSSAYPGRVLTTPISEAGIVGVAAGMALRGLRPIVEIMFGDFITLAADQIINHIAKFRWMYNEQVRLPLMVRTPMGGRRGYGPTHSQTLEKLFLGVPGLHILAPSPLQGPEPLNSQPFPYGGAADLLYRQVLSGEDPALFIENKLLYLLPVQEAASFPDFALQTHTSTAGFPCPTFRLSIQGAPPASLTLAAYGFMAELARQAALRLAYEHEIFVELVVPTRLAPFDLEPVLDSAHRTGRLLTIEEGTPALGWGSEVLAQASEALGARLTTARRLAAQPHPIPASGPLEAATLPGVEEIVAAARLACQA
jgi:pyruvate/2-oxoglutarate/acetoin dehydrogenase E1 component